MKPENLIPIIISSITFLTSLLFFWLAAKQTKKNNSIPVLIDYLREWRKENGVIESYRFITNNFNLEDRQNDEKLTLNEIKDASKRKHAINVSHYFDNLGLLIYSGVLQEKHLVSFVGVNAQKSWEMLRTYIISQRKLNQSDPLGDRYYQIHFEYFASLYRGSIKSLDEELEKLTRKRNLESLTKKQTNALYKRILCFFLQRNLH
ncbi:MAG: hypothetical protein EOO61_11070 [Hymenobacter sp.]|nr:MAG: hypothetical protein EOO61_11070 [Hymenobacter sp.]